MSKKIATAGAIITYLYVVTTTYAASSAPLIQPPTSAVKTNVDINAVPTAFVNILFALATVLAVIYLIFGGIRWITSRGDKAGVEGARKHIVAAIIGLVVVAGTFLIIQVVFQFLGASNPLDKGFTLPTLASPNPS